MDLLVTRYVTSENPSHRMVLFSVLPCCPVLDLQEQAEEENHFLLFFLLFTVSRVGLIQVHFCQKGVKTVAKVYQEDVLEKLNKSFDSEPLVVKFTLK